MKSDNTKPKTRGRHNKRGSHKPITKSSDLTPFPETDNKGKLPDRAVNDPAWYVYDDTMFRGVISTPTFSFKGIEDPLTIPTIGTHDKVFNIAAPTAVIYHMNPSAGYDYATNSRTALNTASRKMYAELSASNAKTSNYAPQDIATLILALGQVLAMSAHWTRFYKLMNYYQFTNRVIPEALVKGYHITESLSQCVQDMANIRARINNTIARINSIRFPQNLPAFHKSLYVYTNVFVDREDDMPTYAMMVPESTWKINETASEEGTVLETYTMSDTASLNTKLSRWESMVEGILTSATFNFIFADLINLANRNVISSDWIEIPYISIDDTISPLYSEQFNWQMMNATVLSTPNSDGTRWNSTPNNDVWPDVNSSSIKYHPTWIIEESSDGVIVTNGRKRGVQLPIRLPDTKVSDEELVEYLAYYNIPSAREYGDDEVIILYPGLSDYYVTSIKYFAGNANSSDYLSSHSISSNIISSDDVHGTLNSNLSLAVKMLNVVHSPMLGIMFVDTDTPSLDNLFILSKLGVYTKVNETYIRNLRYQCFLGLFTFKNL